MRSLLRSATTLDTLEASVRQKLQFATAELAPDFINDDDFGVDFTKLPDDATVVYGAGVPDDKAFRKGLASVGGDMLGQTYTSDNVNASHTNFRENTAVEIEHDFTKAKTKGPNGTWRFTYFKLTSGGHELLIEFVGTTPAYDAPANEADVLKTLGFDMKGFGAQDQYVLEAVGLLPQSVIAKLPPHLHFVKTTVPKAGACEKAPDWAAGDFCKANSTITMFDRWQQQSSVRFARATDMTRAVLHEMGHAIDLTHPQDHADFDTAVQQDGGTKVTGYAEANTLESYAECFSFYIAEPDTLKALRPHVHHYFATTFGAG